MPRFNREQRNVLGPAASKHYQAGSPWSEDFSYLCKAIANEMLRGNRKAMGLRAGRPKKEVLMSADFLDEAWMKLHKRRSALRAARPAVSGMAGSIQERRHG